MNKPSRRTRAQGVRREDRKKISRSGTCSQDCFSASRSWEPHDLRIHARARPFLWSGLFAPHKPKLQPGLKAFPQGEPKDPDDGSLSQAPRRPQHITLLKDFPQQILLNKLKDRHPQQALTHAGFSPINQFIRLATAVDLLIGIISRKSIAIRCPPQARGCVRGWSQPGSDGDIYFYFAKLLSAPLMSRRLHSHMLQRSSNRRGMADAAPAKTIPFSGVLAGDPTLP